MVNLTSFLCLSAIASTALCAPPRPRPGRPGRPSPPSRPGLDCTRPSPVHKVQLQTEQPTNGLVANTNATLQYVGLGVGIQNYSCSSTTAAPTAIGAIATLFDVTKYLAACDDPNQSTLSGEYLDAYEQLSCQASPDLSDGCQEGANRARGFNLLGHHYFISVNGAGVPFFDIYGKATLSGQKVGDVPAPVGAPAGSDGFGAVDWLFLPSDGSSRTSDLSEVYRINTAGGEPDPNGCASGEQYLEYKYAAEYWFYL